MNLWRTVHRELAAACRSLRYDLGRFAQRADPAAADPGPASADQPSPPTGVAASGPAYDAYARRLRRRLRPAAAIALLAAAGAAATYLGVVGSLALLPAGDPARPGALPHLDAEPSPGRFPLRQLPQAPPAAEPASPTHGDPDRPPGGPPAAAPDSGDSVEPNEPPGSGGGTGPGLVPPAPPAPAPIPSPAPEPTTPPIPSPAPEPTCGCPDPSPTAPPSQTTPPSPGPGPSGPPSSATPTPTHHVTPSGWPQRHHPWRWHRPDRSGKSCQKPPPSPAPTSWCACDS